MAHECLNHLGVENVKLIYEKNLVEGFNNDYKDEFTFCDLAMCKGSNIRRHFQSKQLFESIHMNGWGPTKTPSFGGVRYFVSFMDDFS